MVTVIIATLITFVILIIPTLTIINYLKLTRLETRLKLLENQLKNSNSDNKKIKDNFSEITSKHIAAKSEIKVTPESKKQLKDIPLEKTDIKKKSVEIERASNLEEKAKNETEKQRSYDVLEKFLQAFFLKVGSVLLFLAAIWFLKYSLEQLGEYAKIVLSTLIGISISIWGFFDTLKSKLRGSILASTGITIAIASIYIAHQKYHILSSELFIALSIILVAWGIFVSLYRNTQLVAFWSILLLGTLLPASDVTLYPNILLPYLIFINFPAFILAIQREWHSLAILATFWHLSYGTFSAIFGPDYVNLQEIIYSYLAYLPFIIATAYQVLKSVNKRIVYLYFVLSLTSTSVQVLLTSITPSDYLKALILGSWAIILFICGTVIYKIKQHSHVIFVFGSLGLFFTTATIATTINSEFKIFLYSLQFLLSTIAITTLTSNAKLASRSVFFMSIPLILALDKISSTSYLKLPLKPETISTLSVVPFLLFQFYYLLKKFKNQRKEIKAASIFLSISIGLFFTVFTWEFTHANLNKNLATTISLLLYIYLTLPFYFIPNRYLPEKAVQILLFLILAKALFIDIWYLDKLYRIVLTLFMGIAFIATAFKKRLKQPS